MKYLITFILIFCVTTVQSQVPCSQYNRLIQEAQTLIKKQKYLDALRKYNSAKTECPQKQKEVEKSIEQLFMKVDELRIDAQKSKEDAEKAKDKMNNTLIESEKKSTRLNNILLWSSPKKIEKKHLDKEQIESLAYIASREELSREDSIKIIKKADTTMTDTAGLRRITLNKSIKFDNIVFTKNGRINQSAVDEVAKIALFMTDLPYARLRIEGHVAKGEFNTTKEEYETSTLKALSVKDLLVIKYGIDPVRIEVEGYGADRPSVPNTVNGKFNPANQAINRRVEVIPFIPIED
jgi:flagellar motor protein MotB